MPLTKLKPKQLHSLWNFDAIGTQWSVETINPLDASLRQQIKSRIDAFDAIYSRFRDGSLVNRIASHAGIYEFPDDTKDLLELYRKLYDVTNGAVTPLIGNVLSALGYDKDYSLQQREVQPVTPWDSAMSWQGSTVTTTQPVLLDFGAAGKGYLVDIVGAILESNDVEEYVIDASGDIRHRGGTLQTIGLENPYDVTSVIGAVSLQNKSLCASATNRRHWGEGLHHVIDARTGVPTQSVVATWAMADSTAIADGLATALFFVGEDRLTDFSPFDFLRLFADGHVEHSTTFMGELYI